MYSNITLLVLLGLLQFLQVIDGRCVDRNRACTTYARRGYCTKRSSPTLYSWTNRNCQLSCQTCVVPKQKDENLEKIVRRITAAGSALYLVGPKQCGDFMSKCRRYRSLGYCYHPMIKKYCKVSCKLCSPKRSIPIYWNCKDTKPECKLFAFERKCRNGIRTDKIFGMRYCRFSCGYCRRPRTIKCGQPKLQEGSSIVGGQKVGQGLHPWQVAIYFDGELRCGGSLFSERYILTAAHCFYGALDQLQLIKIVLGEHDREKFEGKEQQLSVQRVMIHEDYDPNTQRNDIAMLELDGLADFSDHIDMVCLPSENEELETGENCTVTGWGNVFNMASQSRILQKINVPVVDKTVCTKRNVIGQLSVTDDMICTGYSDGMHIQSACKGDSGGPLSCEDKNGVSKVYGIVSWGSSQCNALEHFNVFTKVSKYIPWIQKQLALAMS